MPVQQVELIGRGVTPTSIRRQYYIHGPAEEDEVQLSLAQLPQFVAGFPMIDFSAKEEDEIPGDWRTDVIWARGPQPLNTVEYRFNFTAPSAHISQSLETIAASPPFNDVVSTIRAPNFYGAINVVDDGGKHRVEGLDLGPPAETFTLSFSSDTDVVTRDYQRTVEKLCGKVNDDVFYESEAGTLLLARVSGGSSFSLFENVPPIWQIEFGFSYIANAVGTPEEHAIIVRTFDPLQPSGPDNFPVSFENKDGQDLLWVYYGPHDDDNANQVVQQPRSAYIERIWPRGDFSELMLPGAVMEEA